MSALKIESSKNVATIFKFWQKLSFKIFDKNVNIGEHSRLYVISQLFFGGREIALERGIILPKVSPKLQAKFWENFVSSKFP